MNWRGHAPTQVVVRSAYFTVIEELLIDFKQNDII